MTATTTLKQIGNRNFPKRCTERNLFRINDYIEKDKLCECAKFIATHGLESMSGYWKTPLHVAAKHGRDAFIPMLVVKCPILMDLPDERCRTPICVAAKHGHLSTVLLLAKLGCKLVDDDENDPSPLHIAVEYGHANIVEAVFHLDNSLLDRVECGGYDPICEAVNNRSIPMIKLLDRLGCKGIRCDTPAADTPYPIHVAAVGGTVEIMQLLLDLGACVDLPDWRGYTAMEIAAPFQGSSKLIELLDHHESTMISRKNRKAMRSLMRKAATDSENFKTVVRLGCNAIDESIFHAAARSFRNVKPIATTITLFPEYQRYFDEFEHACKDDVVKLLANEEFRLNCRYEVHFAESLVSRLLREDRRLTHQRTLKTIKH